MGILLHAVLPAAAPANTMLTVPMLAEDQQERFDTDEVLQSLSRYSEVRYVGDRDLPSSDARRAHFLQRCQLTFANVTQLELEIAHTVFGYQLELPFLPMLPSRLRGSIDMTSDVHRVNIESSPFLLDGVYIRWRGWIDRQTLSGSGRIEYTPEASAAFAAYGALQSSTMQCFGSSSEPSSSARFRSFLRSNRYDHDLSTITAPPNCPKRGTTDYSVITLLARSSSSPARTASADEVNNPTQRGKASSTP